MANFINDLIIDDKITCKQLKMQDVIDNRLPIAIDNLDFSHMVFEEGKLPDLSFVEVRVCFDCSHTNITSFEGFPNVTGIVDISNSQINSLSGCPENAKEIEMSFTTISSFEGCPESVRCIDAWKTNVSNFNGLNDNICGLSVGGTGIRDLSKCPEKLEELTADYLDVSKLDNLPKGLKILSIAASTVEDFIGAPEGLEEITCYQNKNLKGLDGLNIEILKGIAIMDCPNILEEEIDAYHEIIKARTLLEKQEILEAFQSKKEGILRQKEIDKERMMFK